jgi:hypothetical protein
MGSLNYKREQQWYLVAYQADNDLCCVGEWRLLGLDAPTLATMLDRMPSALGYGFLSITVDQAKRLGAWIDLDVKTEMFHYLVECKHILRSEPLAIGK